MDVWCAIRTYPKHAVELGNPIPQEPVFFLKANSSISDFEVVDSKQGDVHHEIELVIQLGENLMPSKMALGLDLTKRSVQDRLKVNQLPWAQAKAFKSSAVIGNWYDFDSRAEYVLTVNGDVKQKGSLAELSWSAEELIAKLATWANLQPGDILFTGTPSGVGPLNPGDHITASLYIENHCISEEKATCI